MSQPVLLYDLVDHVAILTLNNPARRHALSSEVLAALKERLTGIKADPEVRVVVLRSEGPVFSSGHDLRELVGDDEEGFTGIFAECTEVMAVSYTHLTLPTKRIV